MITTKQLARILHEEFDRDGWGDIDPYLFKVVGAGKDDEDDDDFNNAEDLREVLERATARINEVKP
jgi:hypothetical protein